jgi:antirestriction protein
VLLAITLARLCRHDENLQLREDLRGVTVEMDNYKKAMQEVLGLLEDEETKRRTLEAEVIDFEAQKRDLLKELHLVTIP